MNKLQNYRFVCTLSFGDIYGQIIVWLAVIFISLAASLSFVGMGRPVYAFMTLGLVLVLSLPFLLFAFVTTLLNHIELREVNSVAAPSSSAAPSQVQAAQAQAT
ncbi:MAG: hypothetical protein VKJ85_06795 [Prochlorothrix sp.]|nr:hypothetical protein [Prochlorothrix sp.]